MPMPGRPHDVEERKKLRAKLAMRETRRRRSVGEALATALILDSYLSAIQQTGRFGLDELDHPTSETAEKLGELIHEGALAVAEMLRATPPNQKT
jgi:hypothetical protein